MGSQKCVCAVIETLLINRPPSYKKNRALPGSGVIAPGISSDMFVHVPVGVGSDIFRHAARP